MVRWAVHGIAWIRTALSLASRAPHSNPKNQVLRDVEWESLVRCAQECDARRRATTRGKAAPARPLLVVVEQAYGGSAQINLRAIKVRAWFNRKLAAADQAHRAAAIVASAGRAEETA